MNDKINIVETRVIQIKDNTLEISLSQEFIDKMRKHYEIPLTDKITDEQIKVFLLGSMSSALEKLERN